MPEAPQQRMRVMGERRITVSNQAAEALQRRGQVFLHEVFERLVKLCWSSPWESCVVAVGRDIL